MSTRQRGAAGGAAGRTAKPAPPPLSGRAFEGEPPAARAAHEREQPRREIPSFSDTREARIAEAAYWRAERRHFAPGHELEDWLAAEKEIDEREQERSD